MADDSDTRELGWRLSHDSVVYLVERGRLDRVVPQPATSARLMVEARRHLVSAQALSETEARSDVTKTHAILAVSPTRTIA